jgi:hypothetical protein
MTRYRLLISNRKTRDDERAVLPTILYARKTEEMVTCRAIIVGWWAWGIGIMQTKVSPTP